MRQAAALTAIVAAVLLTTSCAGETAGDATAEPATEESAAALFDRAGSSSVVDVGRSSVHEPGSANEAIDFVTTELYSRADLLGVDLLGNGPVIVTFVEPGCAFSAEQSALLVGAAADDVAINYVFIHSGGDAEAFMTFASDANLAEENMIHVDDRDRTLSQRFGVEAYPSTLLVDIAGSLSSSTGSLDDSRLRRALAIVTAEPGV